MPGNQSSIGEGEVEQLQRLPEAIQVAIEDLRRVECSPTRRETTASFSLGIGPLGPWCGSWRVQGGLLRLGERAERLEVESGEHEPLVMVVIPADEQTDSFQIS